MGGKSRSTMYSMFTRKRLFLLCAPYRRRDVRCVQGAKTIPTIFFLSFIEYCCVCTFTMQSSRWSLKFFDVASRLYFLLYILRSPITLEIYEVDYT